MSIEQLTPKEEEALRELARDLIAMGRVRRRLLPALLWLSGLVAAVLLLWDKVPFIGNHK